MYIRGVDFSRGNIIMGTDAEAPVPSTGGNPQLAARNVVEAKVIAAAGGEATIELAGQRVVVQSHVALNAGDKLFVRVQENAGGQIRLSVLQSAPESGKGPPLADDAVDDLLRDLGVPQDARTRQLARALVARDGTLDKGQLQALVRDMKPFSQVGPREAAAAALLQKAGAPITAGTVAIAAARANPEAPPELGAKLDALRPALQAVARQGGPAAAMAAELGTLLAGLPLGDRADPARVAAALRTWIDKLTPAPAKAKAAQAAEASLAADGKDGAPDALPEAGERAMERVRGVRTSPHFPARVGINNVSPSASPARDLASQLEGLAKALGGQHPGLKQQIGEAVAEVRYLQLSNTPTPQGAGASTLPAEFLIPLLTPQLGGASPETPVAIHQPPRKPGEPVDPDNAQLTFVLETEHLATVQADLTVKDGVVSLALGVADPEDRAFLAARLDELQDAIAGLGFETGRFGARQARALPPRVRQAEGLEEVVRFDRRV